MFFMVFAVIAVLLYGAKGVFAYMVGTCDFVNDILFKKRVECSVYSDPVVFCTHRFLDLSMCNGLLVLQKQLQHL